MSQAGLRHAGRAMQLVRCASRGLAASRPPGARADNSRFGDLLTTINNARPEVTVLQALATSCQPQDPCQRGTLRRSTLAWFNQRSLDNSAFHDATSILAQRWAPGALYTPLLFCSLAPCSESLAGYLAAQGWRWTR
jgi:hypothetical protein